MIESRYDRQILLKDFGLHGQEMLRRAKVLVVGVGGLGCPVVQYVAAAGIGQLALIDDDIINVHNLHRQILFGFQDVDKLKVEVAAKKLVQLNDQLMVDTYPCRLDQSNALDLIRCYDVVIDCSDNFKTRYLVNDACVLLHKPLIFGAVNAYEGQVAVFNYYDPAAQKVSGNYRDLFPVMPQKGSVLSCAEAGVLGVLPGIIGCIQASEAIKVITSVGDVLYNRWMHYDMKKQRFDTFTYKLIESKDMPSSEDQFFHYDYEEICTFQEDEIDTHFLLDRLKNHNVTIVDVREHNELPKLLHISHLKLPFSNFIEHVNEFPSTDVIFICQTGKRSLEAVRLARQHFINNRFFSLKGGISHLLDNNINL